MLLVPMPRAHRTTGATLADVFSVDLYTGTGAAKTITNGVNLSANGGLVWMKGRSDATAHALYDTARGATFDIASNGTSVQTTEATGLTAFGSTGFTIGALAKINTSAATYASWTFRKQAKFFDIVTYTGTGSSTTIAHNLGSIPGCIMVKNRTTAGDLRVYHRSLTSAEYVIQLNNTNAQGSSPSAWNSTAPTSSVFSVGANGDINGSGNSYVAYLFAHDAGGFGLAGTDNVISCGSYIGTGAAVSVTLGWEPQFLLVKRSNGAQAWGLMDTTRDFNSQYLSPNSGASEDSGNTNGTTNATGFTIDGNWVQNTGTYIYIAIRVE